MNRQKPNPELTDDTNPEWTDEMFAHAKPFYDSSVSEEFKEEVRRGRPFKMVKKVQTTIRYNVEVIDYFRATGKGWQTRMNDVLKDYMEQHPV